MNNEIISTKIKQWFARHDIVLEFAKMLTENADHCIVVGHNGYTSSIFFYFVKEKLTKHTFDNVTTVENFLTADCPILNKLLFFIYNKEQWMLNDILSNMANEVKEETGCQPYIFGDWSPNYISIHAYDILENPAFYSEHFYKLNTDRIKAKVIEGIKDIQNEKNK